MYAGLLLVFLIIAGSGLYWLGIRKAQRVEAHWPALGEYVDVEGYRLHYVRAGKRSGHTVVLLHGSDGFLQDFSAVLHASLGANLDVIAIDRPGHGYSDAPKNESAPLRAQARLIRSAVRKLGCTRPVLVGHSWSAVLCLFYALEYPLDVRGIVLLSPWAYHTADRPPMLLYAASCIGKHATHILFALSPLKRMLLKRSLRTAFSPASVPLNYEREACAMWLRNPGQIDAFIRENKDAWIRLPELSRQYPQITAPVIILIGDRDKTLHEERHAAALLRDLPRSELQIIPQIGHEVPQLRPDLVLDAVSRCLKLADNGKSEELAQIRRLQARELVFKFGWNVTAYQILNPEVHHWFTGDGGAVVGYVRHYKTRIAAGAPVCEEIRLAEVVRQFEDDAAANSETVCWFASTTRLKSALSETAVHATLVIGAQPVWNPENWSQNIVKNGSLRSQINRARNKEVDAVEWTTQQASDNPDLQRCLDDWIAHHSMPALRFLTEPVTLDRLTDRRVFVAEKHGVPLGYLIATPVPSRQGWLIEQIVRGRAAPNGAAELLVDAAMRALARDGCQYVTLGLVPLTLRERTRDTLPRLWLRVTLSWARLHGRRFYNFEGLDAFKAKFEPEAWEPLFAISNEPSVSLRTLIAIIAAFTDGPILRTAAQAFTAAIRQEIQSLRKRRTSFSSKKRSS